MMKKTAQRILATTLTLALVAAMMATNPLHALADEKIEGGGGNPCSKPQPK